MIITTKTGDRGHTSLYDGSRVEKDDIRIELNGEIDELNAVLGLLKAECGKQEAENNGEGGNALSANDLVESIEAIQRQLVDFMALVARDNDERKLSTLSKAIETMEAFVAEAGKGKKFEFRLPGTSVVDASLHIARAKTRTCERRFVSLKREDESYPELMQVYLNRLSDYFFAMTLRLKA